MKPMTKPRRACVALMVGVAFAPSLSTAQDRLIDRNRIDQGGAVTIDPSTAVPQGGVTEEALPQKKIGFTLKSIRVENSSLPTAKLRPIEGQWRGKHVGEAEIAAITQAVGDHYRKQGYALYTVLAPQQDFNNGVLTLQAIEGHVAEVMIDGDTRGSLELVKAYADQLTKEQPLRQKTLERYVQLMGDIPGLKVDSRFEPMPGGRPGQVRLRLTLQQKRFSAGLGYNNQGPGLLGRSQFEVNATANSFFRDGDRTQLVTGYPDDFNRYELYGVVHEQPLGNDGLRMALTGAHLVTRPRNSDMRGTANSAGMQLSYPLVRSLRTNIIASAGFDGLNSSSAILGQVFSDERTRSLRGGVQASHIDEEGNATAALANVSKGLDAMGARRGSIAFGGPDYTKANIKLVRGQRLPLDLVARAKISGQLAFESLPASEQLTFGGTEFGGGFESARYTGDRGILAALEVAYPLQQQLAGTWVANSEVYSFADYANLTNVNSTYLPDREEASSAGAGVRIGVLDKAVVQLQAATPISSPNEPYLKEKRDWRFLVQLKSVLER